MKIKNYTLHWWKLLLFVGLVVVDLVTKYVIVDVVGKHIDIIDNVIAISPTQNFGAGFSILQNQTWLLIVITLVFLAGYVVFDIKYNSKSKLYNIASALVFAGAIGNLIDRIFFGYVRDFIYLEFINFPIFNVADMCLTFGVILLAVHILFSKDGILKKDNSKQISNENDLSKSENKSIEAQNIEKNEVKAHGIDALADKDTNKNISDNKE